MLLDSHPGYESLVVLPDYPRYRGLARLTTTGRELSQVHVVFIGSDGALSSDSWSCRG